MINHRIALLSGIIAVVGCATTQRGARPEAGFVPDQATAVRIAEAVWIPIYGEGIVEQRPYRASSSMASGGWPELCIARAVASAPVALLMRKSRATTGASWLSFTASNAAQLWTGNPRQVATFMGRAKRIAGATIARAAQQAVAAVDRGSSWAEVVYLSHRHVLPHLLLVRPELNGGYVRRTSLRDAVPAAAPDVGSFTEELHIHRPIVPFTAVRSPRKLLRP
jgi:hypothetical protein